MNTKLLTICVFLSVLLNIFISSLVFFNISSPAVFSGNYMTEEINLIARLHRANYLSSSLKKEIEKNNEKDLPTIISELAKNPNPQALIYGERVMYILMDSESFNGLTKEETRAVIAHEIGHYLLKHTPEPDIQKEIEADRFALDYVDPKALSAAILKLSNYDEEKSVRLKAIQERVP